MHDAGQLDEAERIYRQILETAPDQPDVLNLLGLIAQDKGAHVEACELFSKAVFFKKDNPAFFYNLAFSLKADGKFYEALDNFQKVLMLKPDVKEAYNEMGLIYKKINKTDMARQCWKQALDLDNGFVEAAANLQFSYLDEEPEKTETELKNLCRQYPENPLPAFLLCQLFLKHERWAGAWNAAEKLLKSFPASDDVYVIIGKLALRDKKYDEALGYFTEAIQLNSANVEALLGAADCYSMCGETQKAESFYKRIFELDRDNFNAHNNYAELLQRQNRVAEALEEYRKAVIVNPKSAAVSNNLGTILRQMKDYEQALGLFFNALSLDKSLEEAAVNVSETLILLQREDAQKALDIAENWLKSSPDNVFAKHTVCSLKGETSEVNLEYSQRLFEHFADNYESVVENLDYSAPMAVGRIAGSLKGSIVDLGCGSGLVGEVIKSPENHIVGVDLSAKMLEKARQKNVYEDLVCDDAVGYLRKNKAFDWGIAVDVLGYMSELTDFFAAAQGMKLVFTTEIYDGEEDFKLFPSGRYKHNCQYVQNVLKKNGYLNIRKERIKIRKENDEDVWGCVWFVQ